MLFKHLVTATLKIIFQTTDNQGPVFLQRPFDKVQKFSLCFPSFLVCFDQTKDTQITFTLMKCLIHYIYDKLINIQRRYNKMS